MPITNRALLAALLITAAAPVPALAAQQKPAAAEAAQPQVQPSKEARPALAALQKAVTEKRTAEIPALAQAALAAAKTPADRYFAYQLQLKPALDANNEPVLLAAMEGMIATGIPTGPQLANLYFNAARLNFNANNTDKAAQQIERAIALDANNVNNLLILAEVRNRQKRPAEAVAALQKAMQLQQAEGKAIDQKVADRALGIAYGARLPVARELAMAQLRRSPTTKNWRTALKLYEQTSGLTAADKIDLFRLQRLTGSFEGEGDYFPYVDALMTRGLPGEAKAVLDEAFAANKLDRTKNPWKEMHSSVSARIAADRASLAAGEKSALAAGTARAALSTADAFLSYGDYARAIALYRAALGKSGVDSDLANLRLGIALARSGDKAAAATAFNAVKGSRAGLAQMWLMYLTAPGAAA
jgi:tetratricopeptide (TPR) repeat protein